jgi:hypothetical protein
VEAGLAWATSEVPSAAGGATAVVSGVVVVVVVRGVRERSGRSPEASSF